jgi:hypothetical protein
MMPETVIHEMADENSAIETVEINLDEEISVPDSSADFNEISAPPPADTYPFKLSLNENKGGGRVRDFEIPKGMEVKVDKNRKPFVGVHLIAKLMDSNGTYDGYEIYHYVNSILFSGKSTSELHSLLTKLGVNVPNTMPLTDLITLANETFSENPICTAELDWEASYKKEGEKNYVKQCKKMRDFPKNDDGTFNHIVSSDLDGSPLYARGIIKKFVSQ